MELIQKIDHHLFDIIGDVHGEIKALKDLIEQLGYNPQGEHPTQRKLIFVGDLCDRGPNSVAVLAYVKQLVENQNAYCILGNHELNILLTDVTQQPF